MQASFVPFGGMIFVAALCAAAPLAAQSAPSGGSPAPAAAASASGAIDPASLAMPDIVFQPTPDDVEGFDKYFIFHRDETDFATAYADLQECDGYARGLSYRNFGGPVPYPYAGTIGGAIGGAIGSAIADAVFGSAERRRLRRVNMRACMQFKGYQRFGLRKSLWEQFNFEEGNSHVEEGRRQHLLQLQARVASGPRPLVGEIEP
jgi:hypothetical protein